LIARHPLRGAPARTDALGRRRLEVEFQDDDQVATRRRFRSNLRPRLSADESDRMRAPARDRRRHQSASPRCAAAAARVVIRHGRANTVVRVACREMTYFRAAFGERSCAGCVRVSVRP